MFLCKPVIQPKKYHGKYLSESFSRLSMNNAFPFLLSVAVLAALFAGCTTDIPQPAPSAVQDTVFRNTVANSSE